MSDEMEEARKHGAQAGELYVKLQEATRLRAEVERLKAERDAAEARVAALEGAMARVIGVWETPDPIEEDELAERMWGAIRFARAALSAHEKAQVRP